MRPKGSKAELEARRIHAVKLVAEGRTHTEVAHMVGATQSTVSRWVSRFRKGGKKALASKRHPGRKPQVGPEDWKRLEELLLQGPEAHGFRTDLWTCERVGRVIRKHFGVRLHSTSVLRLLWRMNWTAQKPERRARERDEGAIATWRRVIWPHIKKGRR